MRKTLLGIVLLVGTAVGQDSGYFKQVFPYPHGDGTIIEPVPAIAWTAFGGSAVYCLTSSSTSSLTCYKAEAIDVPAITKKKKKHNLQACGEGCIVWEEPGQDPPTCADKARVLQHDEDTPAKYWCHKVQP